MRRWNDISARVFIRLLSEALVRRLSLGPAEQQAIAAVCGLFYFSNFVQGEVDAEEKERIAVAVSRITRISPQSVMRFYEGDVPQADSLDGFCNALRHVVQNPRLERVDAAFIITLMGGVWFGGQARMVVAVALEYPPVWLALIYQALTDRSFHGASLTKMVETENRGNAGAQFIRDVGSYLDL
ncbi:virion structural protein [Xanthomonas phage RTH11]|nr:virion structural protein [Xanthomonas phage RTH11]